MDKERCKRGMRLIHECVNQEGKCRPRLFYKRATRSALMQIARNIYKEQQASSSSSSLDLLPRSPPVGVSWVNREGKRI